MEYVDVNSDDEDVQTQVEEMDKPEEEEEDGMEDDNVKEVDQEKGDSNTDREKHDDDSQREDDSEEDEVTNALGAGNADCDNDSQGNGAVAHKAKHPVTKYGPPISKRKH